MVLEQSDRTYAAGGASNVAVNLVAMEGEASIACVVGQDAEGDRLRSELDRHGVRHSGVVADPGRPTTVKTRIIAQSHQLLRVDREHRAEVGDEVSRSLVAAVGAEVAWADAILLSDYGKGVFTEALTAEILSLAAAGGKPVSANPKPGNIHLFRHVSLVTLNQSEAEAVTRLCLADLSQVEAAGCRVLELCQAEAAIITLGGRGLALFERGRPGRHLPVVPLEVYDPCGCGDSAIAAATLARAAGADWVEAATLANLAGTAKVRKLGVVPVSRSEIQAVWSLGRDCEP